eukprot:CAMPEP_0182439856 /NCGR_PEP_ID=MMETSP1167-20130531/86697_1 /TAXON_ID=2988 /ORGANISM="Mallomonas Sp, Strain CCMP3275" /LENGTH=667 /DNA_ID=CAMNT_0024633657 /DNA_START=48 /DNA_END=2051 /DNA_ORIENTATION=-
MPSPPSHATHLPIQHGSSSLSTRANHAGGRPSPSHSLTHDKSREKEKDRRGKAPPVKTTVAKTSQYLRSNVNIDDITVETVTDTEMRARFQAVDKVFTRREHAEKEKEKCKEKGRSTTEVTDKSHVKASRTTSVSSSTAQVSSSSTPSVTSSTNIYPSTSSSASLKGGSPFSSCDSGDDTVRASETLVASSVSSTVKSTSRRSRGSHEDKVRNAKVTNVKSNATISHTVDTAISSGTKPKEKESNSKLLRAKSLDKKQQLASDPSKPVHDGNETIETSVRHRSASGTMVSSAVTSAAAIVPKSHELKQAVSKPSKPHVISSSQTANPTVTAASYSAAIEKMPSTEHSPPGYLPMKYSAQLSPPIPSQTEQEYSFHSSLSLSKSPPTPSLSIRSTPPSQSLSPATDPMLPVSPTHSSRPPGSHLHTISPSHHLSPPVFTTTETTASTSLLSDGIERTRLAPRGTSIETILSGFRDHHQIQDRSRDQDMGSEQSTMSALEYDTFGGFGNFSVDHRQRGREQFLEDLAWAHHPPPSVGLGIPLSVEMETEYDNSSSLFSYPFFSSGPTISQPLTASDRSGQPRSNSLDWVVPGSLSSDADSEAGELHRLQRLSLELGRGCNAMEGEREMRTSQNQQLSSFDSSGAGFFGDISQATDSLEPDTINMDDKKI